MTTEDLAQAVIASARSSLRRSFEKIDHCLRQLTDEQVWWRPTAEQNAIANLLLHLAGNLRQWVVSGIGGAADIRVRQQEFAERAPLAKAELREKLACVVREAEAVLGRLPADDLLSPRCIQSVDTIVISAMWQTITHFEGHTQEIICLTRMQLGAGYQFDYIPTRAEGGV